MSFIRNKIPLLAIATSVLASCGDDKSVSPPSATYTLLTTIAKPGGMALEAFDAESGARIHRVEDTGDPNAYFLTATNDGRYFSVLSQSHLITLFNGADFDLVASVPTKCWHQAFSGTAAFLVATRIDSTIVYEVPSGERAHAIGQGYEFLLTPHDSNEVIAIARRRANPYQEQSDSYLSLSMPTGEITDSFTFKSPQTDGRVTCQVPPVLSPDGNYIYLLAADDAGFAIFCFGLQSGDCLFRTAVATDKGSIAIRPDGEEVWITQSWYSIIWPSDDLGYVLVLDASTGAPVDTIHTLGHNQLFPEHSLYLKDIAFHQTLPRAYIAARLSKPGILVVNTDSKSIDSTFYSDTLVNVFEIAVIPQN